jgi:diaminopimelate decarboxylase
MRDLSWNLLEKLARRYGDFFYLLDLKKFRNNYAHFLQAFRSIYPNTYIAYSYKTNYIPRLCKLVNSFGGYAEVVSRMEYDLAVRIGVSPDRIIFNGPVKFHEDIKTALLNGSIVNLDSLVEVSIVRDIALKMSGRRFTVGIRCNFDIGTGIISRFGFDIEGKELERAFNMLSSIDNCSIEGLHCHFSSPQRSIDSYVVRTRKMLDLSAKYFDGNQLKFIDLGGGFCGKMDAELKKQLDYYCPTYQEYAEVIASQFSKEFYGIAGPKLILEPGIAIVGNIMSFVCRIAGTKRIRSKNFAQATGSVYNIKPTLHNKNMPVKIYSMAKRKRKMSEVYDITGFTCMENDYLYKGYRGSISQGDYAIFNNAGAYTNVLTPPFIRSAPPIVAVDPVSGRCELIRAKESFDDVFLTYKMK